MGTTKRQKLSKFGYKKIVKPVLFKVSPDRVHSRMVKASSGMSSLPILLKTGKKWFTYKPAGSLAQDLAGLHFESPIGLAAGLDKNGQMMHVADMIGCGFTTVGSVTYEPRLGNKRPWFYRLPKSHSIIVHAGMPNKGLPDISLRLKHRPRSLPTFVSVAVVAQQPEATPDMVIQDVLQAIEYIKDNKLAEALEINISCPNIQDKEFFTDPTYLDMLLSSVDQQNIRIPVFLKMPNRQQWADFEPMLDVITKHNVQGLTIANLIKDRENVTLRDQFDPSIKGGLSGLPTQQRATELIRRTRQKCGDRFILIGLGGIFTAKDAYEKLRAGANLVEVATGLIFEGPQVVNEINAGLEKLLKQDGYKTISELARDTHKH